MFILFTSISPFAKKTGIYDFGFYLHKSLLLMSKNGKIHMYLIFSRTGICTGPKRHQTREATTMLVNIVKEKRKTLHNIFICY